jgi:hypothetical protein
LYEPGNIGDEGKPKPLSGDAETSVDSLMSKFDLDGGGVDATPEKKVDRSTRNFDIKDTTKVTKKD